MYSLMCVPASFIVREMSLPVRLLLTELYPDLYFVVVVAAADVFVVFRSDAQWSRSHDQRPSRPSAEAVHPVVCFQR